MKSETLLTLAGTFSLLAAILHLLIILGGPDWYRFFGAGEGMALLAEQGADYPTNVTLMIAFILSIWSVYAFSGAGRIRTLPLLKPVLFFVAGVFLIRGFIGIPMVMLIDHPYLNELQEKMTFIIISSLISLGIGFLYFFGGFKLSKAV